MCVKSSGRPSDELAERSAWHGPQRYETYPVDDDSLRLALIRLAKQYGRYGYRNIAELLRIEGWQINHKKVERLWREEDLKILQRHRKRKRLYHKDNTVSARHIIQ